MTRSRLTREALARLLASHGRLFSEALEVDLSRRDPRELFRWFLASMLFGMRITESVAVRTYRAFVRHGLDTPEALANADFGELLDIMAEGHYVRYDGITSRKVQEAAQRLLGEYGGDLNRLHESARDPADLLARLTAFRGVGPVTAGIFLRELRGIWEKADPPLGHLAGLAASHLGVADPKSFWERNAVPGYDFRHLEAALTRIGRDYCRRRRCDRAPVPH